MVKRKAPEMGHSGKSRKSSQEKNLRTGALPPPHDAKTARVEEVPGACAAQAAAQDRSVCATQATARFRNCFAAEFLRGW